MIFAVNQDIHARHFVFILIFGLIKNGFAKFYELYKSVNLTAALHPPRHLIQMWQGLS